MTNEYRPRITIDGVRIIPKTNSSGKRDGKEALGPLLTEILKKHGVSQSESTPPSSESARSDTGSTQAPPEKP